MKIEWLDPERCHEAIVTRGWFRKRQARVVWFVATVHGEWSGWMYALNGERCEEWLSTALYEADANERARRLAERKRSAWQPVDKFPRASLVERKS